MKDKTQLIWLFPVAALCFLCYVLGESSALTKNNAFVEEQRVEMAQIHTNMDSLRSSIITMYNNGYSNGVFDALTQCSPDEDGFFSEDCYKRLIQKKPTANKIINSEN